MSDGKELSSYNTIKTSLKRSYPRIMFITDSGIYTINPSTLKITNDWVYDDIEKIESLPENQFVLHIRWGRSGGLLSNQMCFYSQNKVDILTDILDCSSRFSQNYSKEHFTAIYLSKKVDVKLVVEPVGLMIISPGMKKKIVYFKLFNKIRIRDDILYLINPQTEQYKAFSKTSCDLLKRKICTIAKESLGLSVITDDKIELHHSKYGIYSDLANLSVKCQYYVEVFKEKNNNSPHIARYFCICMKVIMLKNVDTMAVTSMRPLSKISSIHVDSHDPQAFTISWIDYIPRSVKYHCHQREHLVCTLVDSVRLVGNADVYVSSVSYNPKFRYGALGEPIDPMIEKTLLQRLGNVDFESICAFNSNISYSGYRPAEKSFFFSGSEAKLIHNTLTSLASSEYLACPVPKTIYYEQIYFAVRRIFATSAGFAAFSQTLGLASKIGKNTVMALNSTSKMTVYALIEMLSAVIQPLHTNPDLSLEINNKTLVLSDDRFVTNIITVFEHQSIVADNALLISSFLEFFTFIICPPYNSTTSKPIFNNVVVKLTAIASKLFSLCSHESSSVVKSASFLLRTILEESSDEKRLSLQELALKNGSVLSHLLISCFNDNLFNRQLSRQFLALWLYENPDGHSLLKRIFPIGLYALLNRTGEESFSKNLDLVHIRDNDELVKIHEEKQANPEILLKIDTYVNNWHDVVAKKFKIQRNYRRLEDTKLELFDHSRELSSKSISAFNWNLFYERFPQNHFTPGLIWDAQTRLELRQSLEKELNSLKNFNEINGQNFKTAWNAEEFMVDYTSLSAEIKIGDYYLGPLLKSPKDLQSNVPDPYKFLNDLYNSFLQSTNEGNKLVYLESMNTLYEQCHEKIGKFTHIPYLLHVMQKSNDYRQRDLLVQFIIKLSLNKDNVRILLDNGGIEYLIRLATLAHTQSERIVLPLENLMLDSADKSTDTYEVPCWFIKGSEEKFTFSQLKEKYLAKEVDENTKIFTDGMTHWVCMGDHPQFRWGFMATGIPIFTPSELACNILDMLISICQRFPILNRHGDLLMPLSRVNNAIGNAPLINYICQLILTFNHSIVCKVVEFVTLIMTGNPSVNRIHQTGFYYYVLMYAGSNLEGIMKFLKYSHQKQGFTTNSKLFKSQITKQSILAPMLPEALICALTRRGESESIASLMLTEQDTPENIWSEEMRKFLIRSVTVHLCDFMNNLKNHILAVYRFVHIPYIKYDRLECELFCGGYYLRNLCDLTRFPDFVVESPVDLLNNVINEWRNLLTDDVPIAGRDEYLSMLELDPKVENSDTMIRRKFMELTRRYHPDKCQDEDAPEKMEAVLKAYNFLCSPEAKIVRSVDDDLSLILRSQLLLFTKYTKQLEKYRYSGYPMIIEYLKSEMKKSDHSNLFKLPVETNQFLLSIQLLHSTANCCRTNVHEWLSSDIFVLLMHVLSLATNSLSHSFNDEDGCAIAAVCLVRTFSIACHFQQSINLLSECDDIILIIDHALQFNKNIPTLALSVLELIHSLCSNSVIVRKMFSTSIIFHLICYLFNYDVTVEINLEMDDSSHRQALTNKVAIYACQTFNYIFNDMTVFSEVQNEIQILKSLLPFHVIRQMTNSTMQVLTDLNSDCYESYFIWNSRTRSELLGMMEKFKCDSPENDLQNLELCRNHIYAEYSKYFYLNSIFVDVYNEKQAIPLELTSLAFSDMMNYLINTRLFIGIKSITTMEDMPSDISIDECQKITMVLKAMASFVHFYRTSLDSMLDVEFYETISILFLIISDVNLQLAAAEIFFELFSTVSNEVKANRTIFNRLMIMLNDTTEDNQPVILKVFQSISKSQIYAGMLYEIGLYAVTLDILCKSTVHETINSASSLLNSLVSDSVFGIQVQAALQKFLPRPFIDCLVDNHQVMMTLLGTDHESPELFWNEEVKTSTLSTLSEVRTSIFKSQSQDFSAVFTPPDKQLWISHLGEGMYISNININAYLKNPAYNLRHAAFFYNDLVQHIFKNLSVTDAEERNSSIYSSDEGLKTMSSCLISFLTYNPGFKQKVGSAGYGTITYFCKAFCATYLSELQTKCLLEIIKCIITEKRVAIEFLNGPSILSAFAHFIKNRNESSVEYLKLLTDLIENMSTTHVATIMENSLIAHLFDALKISHSDIKFDKAFRAYLVSTLQKLEQYFNKYPFISQIFLENESLWSLYKNQSQDLFLAEKFTLQLESAPRSTQCGYLEAATSSSSIPRMYQDSNLLALEEHQSSRKIDEQDTVIPQ